MHGPCQMHVDDSLLIFKHFGKMSDGAAQRPIAKDVAFIEATGLKGCRSSWQEGSPGSGAGAKLAAGQSGLLEHREVCSRAPGGHPSAGTGR